MEKSPRVNFDGDVVVVDNFRNFRYQGDGSHEEKYETRSIKISDLATVDFIVVPFATHPDLAHTMMSFGTRCGQYSVVSIEARRKLNQKFGIIKGTLGAFRLMYVIADERDAIGQRTELQGDDVFLYKSNATSDQVQTFFKCVMMKVDELSRTRETYNTVTNNCLTNIRTHVNEIWPGRIPWNWRILINGHSDFLAFKLGLLESEQSFESTQEEANITSKAKGNLKRDDFSALIRT